MDTTFIGRSLLVLGLLIALTGIAVLVLPHVPLIGRLPGDISVHRRRFSFYFPLVTSIILSIVLTVVLNIVIRITSR